MEPLDALALGGFLGFSIGMILISFIKNKQLVFYLIPVIWFIGVGSFGLMSYLSFKNQVISAGIVYILVTIIMVILALAFLTTSITDTLHSNRRNKHREINEANRKKAWNYFEGLDSTTQARLLENARDWFGYEYPHLLNDRLLVIEYLLSGKHNGFTVK